MRTILAFFTLTAGLFAQHFTTLTYAMTAAQTRATVASATYVTLPANPTNTSGSIAVPTGNSFTVLYVDGEAMAVLATGASTTEFKVFRGYAGTLAEAHLAAAKVWVGPANLFNVLNPGSTLASWGITATGPDIDSTGTNVTVVPKNPIQHVSAAGSIQTITAPDAFKITGGCLVLIPDPASPFTLATGGNIAHAVTAVQYQRLKVCYDAAGATWYPSYH